MIAYNARQITDSDALYDCVTMLNDTEGRLIATKDTLRAARATNKALKDSYDVEMKKARRTGFKCGVGVTTVAAIVLGLVW